MASRQLVGGLGAAALALLVGNVNQSAWGMSFTFTKGSGILALESGTTSQQLMASQAMAGFQQAANFWSSRLSDPITINLKVDYASLATNILGQSGSNLAWGYDTEIKGALIADGKSADDLTALVHLPAGTLAMVRNQRDGTQIYDNGSTPTTINSTIVVTTANAKALGFDVGNVIDSSITFSSNYQWDFTHSSTIASNKFDFIGMAAHEIGHSLGFMSGVDTMDAYTGIGPDATTDLNGTAAGIGELTPYEVFMPLDLFRYSTDSLSHGTGILDLATGGNPYFSIDGGTTNLAPFSTGFYNGNGDQASHWLDLSSPIGIMDPTGAPGELLNISAVDIRALDVIGYDVVPEPGTASILMGMGLVALSRRRRVA